MLHFDDLFVRKLCGQLHPNFRFRTIWLNCEILHKLLHDCDLHVTYVCRTIKKWQIGMVLAFYFRENSIRATTTPWNWVSRSKSCHSMAWFSTWDPTLRNWSGMDQNDPLFYQLSMSWWRIMLAFFNSCSTIVNIIIDFYILW